MVLMVQVFLFKIPLWRLLRRQCICPFRRLGTQTGTSFAETAPCISAGCAPSMRTMATSPVVRTSIGLYGRTIICLNHMHYRHCYRAGTRRALLLGVRRFWRRAPGVHRPGIHQGQRQCRSRRRVARLQQPLFHPAFPARPRIPLCRVRMLWHRLCRPARRGGAGGASAAGGRSTILGSRWRQRSGSLRLPHKRCPVTRCHRFRRCRHHKSRGGRTRRGTPSRGHRLGRRGRRLALGLPSCRQHLPSPLRCRRPRRRRRGRGLVPLGEWTRVMLLGACGSRASVATHRRRWPRRLGG